MFQCSKFWGGPTPPDPPGDYGSECIGDMSLLNQIATYSSFQQVANFNDKNSRLEKNSRRKTIRPCYFVSPFYSAVSAFT
jgi:hypothetical protein